jgi:hypothetical protein
VESLGRFHLKAESASLQDDRGRFSFQVEAPELQPEASRPGNIGRSEFGHIENLEGFYFFKTTYYCVFILKSDG